MPYKNNQELPRDVRESLPEDAQTTYRTAYNQSCDPKEDMREPDVQASKAGWSAVERDFEQVDGQWSKRQTPKDGQFTGQYGTETSRQGESGMQQQGLGAGRDRNVGGGHQGGGTGEQGRQSREGEGQG
jgi:cation transport regulator ChaB